MDKKHQSVSTIKHHQELLSEQSNNDNFCRPVVPPPAPKVTVSLPKHAASKLRDLVQRRDIALLRLGIISVQFDDDQIIPLTLNATNSLQPKHQQEQQQQQLSQQQQSQQQQSQQQPSVAPPVEHIIGAQVQTCNPGCIGSLDDTSITALTGLTSPGGPIIGENEELESNMHASGSPMLDSTSIVVSTGTNTTTTTTHAQSTLQSKSDRNTTNKLPVVYDDDEDEEDDKDEDVNEVENQHSSYNIHQLSQLEFADPIELDLYDNDNLLFPDYTLNLS